LWQFMLNKELSVQECDATGTDKNYFCW